MHAFILKQTSCEHGRAGYPVEVHITTEGEPHDTVDILDFTTVYGAKHYCWQKGYTYELVHEAS